MGGIACKKEQEEQHNFIKSESSDQNLEVKHGSVHEGSHSIVISVRKVSTLSNTWISIQIMFMNEMNRLCVKYAVRPQSLNTHVASVHEENKPFKCEICDYSCKASLKTHVDSVHKGKNLFKCAVCNQILLSKHSLMGHISSVLEGKKAISMQYLWRQICSKTQLRFTYCSSSWWFETRI